MDPVASRFTWMRDWLISPSLGHYLQIQPGDKKNGSSKNIQSTKLLLKKHMVDTFFEQALHQIDPEAVEVPQPQVASYEEHIVDSQVEEVVAVEELEESPIGYYVFAIALKHYELTLPDVGIDPDFPIFVFPYGKTQAIISEIPLDIYGEEALQARLNDASWFEQTLKIHNLILGQIQSQSSMVPMRVCTICDNIDALKAFLGEHHEDFVTTLELIEDNEAWGLSIVCNQRKLRLLTERASNRVRAIYAEMAGKSGDEAEELARKVETMLEDEARSVCKACIKHSHGTLSVMSTKSLVQTPDPTGDAMQEIFKSQYLVKRGRSDAFIAEAKTLVESYKSLGFELVLEGPQPPSEFTEQKIIPGPIHSMLEAG